MKTVIIHIGTGKTGTSSIQNYIANNRYDLVNNWALDYIDYGLDDYKYFNERMVAHYPVAEWLLVGDMKNLINMKKAIDNSPCSTVLLSCENFYHSLCSTQISLLSEVLKTFNVIVVCYVRRQDFAAESAWKQQIRVGLEKVPFKVFIKKHKDRSRLSKVQLNYFRMLAPWEQVFGKKNIKLRIFQKTSFVGGDLLHDFFSTIGLPNAYEPVLECHEDSNKSLSSGLIELIRVINELSLVSKANHHSLVNVIESSSASFSNIPLLDIQDRRDIIENYSEVNEKLFNKYKCNDETMEFNISDIF